MPKGTDLSLLTETDLDAIANQRLELLLRAQHVLQPPTESAAPLEEGGRGWLVIREFNLYPQPIRAHTLNLEESTFVFKLNLRGFSRVDM